MVPDFNVTTVKINDVILPLTPTTATSEENRIVVTEEFYNELLSVHRHDEDSHLEEVIEYSRNLCEEDCSSETEIEIAPISLRTRRKRNTHPPSRNQMYVAW